MAWRQISVIYCGPSGVVMGRVSGGRRAAASDVTWLPVKEDSSERKVALSRLRGGGEAVLLWPRRACTVKRVLLPPVQGERLSAVLHFALEGELPFSVAEAAVAAHVTQIAETQRMSAEAHTPAEVAAGSCSVIAFCARTSDIVAEVDLLGRAGFRVIRVIPATLALYRSLSLRQGPHVHLEVRSGDTEALFMDDGQLLAAAWFGEQDASGLAGQVQLWWRGLQRAGVAKHAHLSIRTTVDAPQALPERLAGLFATFEETETAPLPPTRAYGALLVEGGRAERWPGAPFLELTPTGIRRERQRREQRQKLAIGALVLTAGIAFAIGAGRLRLTNQELRRDRLAAQWNALAPRVQAEAAALAERDALLREVEAWTNVVISRETWSQVLRELVQALPPGVGLWEMRLEKGKPYQLTGHATSSAAAALFLEQLRHTHSWADARLDLVKQVPGDATPGVSFIVAGSLRRRPVEG